MINLYSKNTFFKKKKKLTYVVTLLCCLWLIRMNDVIFEVIKCISKKKFYVFGKVLKMKVWQSEHSELTSLNLSFDALLGLEDDL